MCEGMSDMAKALQNEKQTRLLNMYKHQAEVFKQMCELKNERISLLEELVKLERQKSAALEGKLKALRLIRALKRTVR